MENLQVVEAVVVVLVLALVLVVQLLVQALVLELRVRLTKIFLARSLMRVRSLVREPS